jgi:hypothetical protein
MPIIFDCPECRASLEFGDAAAGNTVTCPGCKTIVPVPQPEKDLSIVSLPTPFPPTRDVRRAWRFSLSVLRAIVWSSCVLFCGAVAVEYLRMLDKAQSAIQEASLAATACFWIILPYIVARAIDSATRW